MEAICGKGFCCRDRGFGVSMIKRLMMLVMSACIFSGAAARADGKVVLQLKWRHQFQFAGYYAAMEKGYYSRAGIDVEIREGAPNLLPIEMVARNRAQYGIAGPESLLQRLQGKPIVVLAAVFQHSPRVIVVGKDSGINSVQDLVGRKVAMGRHVEVLAENYAMLLMEGVSPDRLDVVDTWDYNALITKKVDAYSCYITVQPYELQRRNFPISIIRPASYGIDFYGDCLLTSEREIKDHPERVAAFREASLAGWRYAMENPEEIIELILKKYAAGTGKTAAHLAYEARAMASLINAQLVGIGHMNPGRWRHIADTYAKLGLIPGDYSLDGFIYDPLPGGFDWGHRFVKLGAGILFLFIGGFFILLFFNRRIKREVNERRQAEREKRLSEIKLQNYAENMKTIFNSTPNILVLVNSEGRVEMINQRGTAFLGEPGENLVGHLGGHVLSCLNAFGDEGCGTGRDCDRCPVRTRVMATFETREARMEEEGRMTFLMGGEERTMDLLISTSLLRLEGTPKVLLSLTDITERKEGEEELRRYKDNLEKKVAERTWELKRANNELKNEIELRKKTETLWKTSQQRLVDAIETIEDGFVLYDAEDKLVMCNTRYREIFSKSADMIRPGASFEEIVRAGAERGEFRDAEGRVDAWVKERLAAHRNVGVSMEQHLSDGTWLKTTERRMNNGDVVGFRVDITDYKLTEQALEKAREDLEIRVETEVNKRLAAEEERREMTHRLYESQKMESIGKLAGGIAHDFNNLLYPIIGMSELLMEDLSTGTMEHDNAVEIFNAGQRGSALVKQILTFSRQSRGIKVPVRFQDVLEEALKLTRSTIPANIEIGHHIEPDCGRVLADATQLHQIAMNLITNAFHALENTSGRITVALEKAVPPCRAAASMPCVRLSVTDNGTGMPEGVVSKIFEPYFTTKEEGKGTGLGLAVVYGIVKEHNGDIEVHSEPGRGTTFHVYIPLMEKSTEAATLAPAPDLPTGSERVLVVDDEASVARLVRVTLERLGYRVTERTASTEALGLFREAPDAFDLVLTDMTMPEMTGDQLTRELLGVRPDIPVIVCTGFSERMDQKTAGEMGIKGFLMKPVVRAELAREVRKVLDDH